ncbi:MAG: hypothetical protein K1X74_06230 [Pirellulales bacterium]|nr:hypothetical protein [Pirellulales bacterium]
MTARRSLDNALDISADKLAFIRGQAAKSTVTLNAPVTSPPVPEEEAFPEPVANASKPPARPRNRRADPAATGQAAVTAAYADQFRVGLTVRIAPQIADALRRAHLEHKLRRQAPDTQQEIVEVALTHWLKDHGFWA